MKKYIKRLFGEKREIIGKIKYAPMNILCAFFPMKKEILLESHPDLACNTFQLYKYMISVGLNKEYKITWMVNESNHFFSNEKNVSFIDINPTGVLNRILFYIRANRAAAIITSNRHVGKMYTSRKQLNVYLDHGSHLKAMANVNGRKIVSCGYLLSQSEFFVKYNLQEYVVNKEQIFCAGLPRNDVFFHSNTNSIEKLIPDLSNYQKVIIWVPTFRQHMSTTRIDCDFSMPLGIPILYNENDVQKLNALLIDRKILLIIKPHPAQNMHLIKDMKCSNIRFVVNDDLVRAGIQTNELLAQTDAMITDYSSIYYDYLLADKPIAITLDDYDAYENQKGFVFDDPLSILKGEYIYSLTDLISFVNNVADGRDVAKDARNEIKNMTHDYQDGKSSERVYQFIISHLKV